MVEVVSLRREPLAQVLEAAGVRRSSLIRVAGTGGLPVLLWLCRNGYERAGCVTCRARGPREDADALIVAPTCSPDQLEVLLVRGPHVRPGGVVIVRSSPPLSANGGDPVHATLARHGLTPELCLRGARRELHMARRTPPLRRAA